MTDNHLVKTTPGTAEHDREHLVRFIDADDVHLAEVSRVRDVSRIDSEVFSAKRVRECLLKGDVDLGLEHR